MEAEISKLKEAAEAAKRKHELKLAQLAQGNLDGRIGVREDRAPHLWMVRTSSRVLKMMSFC